MATTLGTWTVQAEYLGDTEHAASKSAACTVEVT